MSFNDYEPPMLRPNLVGGIPATGAPGRAPAAGSSRTASSPSPRTELEVAQPSLIATCAGGRRSSERRPSRRPAGPDDRGADRAHLGGPFWARRERAAWSFPKGEARARRARPWTRRCGSSGKRPVSPLPHRPTSIWDGSGSARARPCSSSSSSPTSTSMCSGPGTFALTLRGRTFDVPGAGPTPLGRPRRGTRPAGRWPAPVPRLV